MIYRKILRGTSAKTWDLQIGTYYVLSLWSCCWFHLASVDQTESPWSLCSAPCSWSHLLQIGGLEFETNKWFCVGAITMEIIDGPLASLLLVHLYPIMPCSAFHATCLCVCVFRTLQAPQPFSGSQPQVLWSSRETREYTSSNGINLCLKYKPVSMEIKCVVSNLILTHLTLYDPSQIEQNIRFKISSIHWYTM